jgi:hypothetical protein
MYWRTVQNPIYSGQMPQKDPKKGKEKKKEKTLERLRCVCCFPTVDLPVVANREGKMRVSRYFSPPACGCPAGSIV